MANSSINALSAAPLNATVSNMNLAMQLAGANEFTRLPLDVLLTAIAGQLGMNVTAVAGGITIRLPDQIANSTIVSNGTLASFSNSPTFQGLTINLNINVGGTATLGNATLSGNVSTVGNATFNNTIGDSPLKDVSGNYTLVLGDRGFCLNQTNSNASVITFPSNANVAFRVGAEGLIHQPLSGNITLSNQTGVTLRPSTTNGTASGGQNTTFWWKHVFANNFTISGGAS